MLQAMPPTERWKCLGAERLMMLPAELWKLYIRAPQEGERQLAEWLDGKCFGQFNAERGWLTEWLQTAKRVEIHVRKTAGSALYWDMVISCHFIESGRKKKKSVECRVDLTKGTITAIAMLM